MEPSDLALCGFWLAVACGATERDGDPPGGVPAGGDPGTLPAGSLAGAVEPAPIRAPTIRTAPAVGGADGSGADISSGGTPEPGGGTQAGAGSPAGGSPLTGGTTNTGGQLTGGTGGALGSAGSAGEAGSSPMAGAAGEACACTGGECCDGCDWLPSYPYPAGMCLTGTEATLDVYPWVPFGPHECWCVAGDPSPACPGAPRGLACLYRNVWCSGNSSACDVLGPVMEEVHSDCAPGYRCEGAAAPGIAQPSEADCVPCSN